jgi:hypothetical protein
MPFALQKKIEKLKRNFLPSFYCGSEFVFKSIPRFHKHGEFVHAYIVKQLHLPRKTNREVLKTKLFHLLAAERRENKSKQISKETQARA